MPGSIRENNADFIGWVKREKIRTVLDVGVGWGTYENLLGSHVDYMDGIEVWEPYIKEFNLRARYRHLAVSDVRDVVKRGSSMLDSFYDLVIFGDILEHMSQEEALEVWRWAPTIASIGMISLPMRHYHQGAEDGNPFQIHPEDHLTGEDLQDNSLFGPFDVMWTYDVTGTFIRRFS